MVGRSKRLYVMAEGDYLIHLARFPSKYVIFIKISIVTRYLTQKPKLPAGRELKGIVATLPQSNRSDFENSLEQWHQKWAPFLSEKSINWETGKQTYTHRRIRSAYRSLKTNLPYLFTYQNYPDLTYSKYDKIYGRKCFRI